MSIARRNLSLILIAVATAALAAQSVADCNSNGVDDALDIASGTSLDCNGNLLPDECESGRDCNANGILDICDIAGGTSLDACSGAILVEDNRFVDILLLLHWWVVYPVGPPYDAPFLYNPSPVAPSFFGTVFDVVEDSGNIALDAVSGRATAWQFSEFDSVPVFTAITAQGNASGVGKDKGAIHSDGGFGQTAAPRAESVFEIRFFVYQPQLFTLTGDVQLDKGGIGIATGEVTLRTTSGDTLFASNTEGPINASGLLNVLPPDEYYELTAEVGVYEPYPSPCDYDNNNYWDCNFTPTASFDLSLQLADGNCSDTSPESDCDGNGVNDICDIAGAGPDVDCDENGILDVCEFAQGSAHDCHGDGILDECQLSGNDCNANLVPDDCEIVDTPEADCNANDILDHCEPSGDCNANGILDVCDIAGGTSLDDCQSVFLTEDDRYISVELHGARNRWSDYSPAGNFWSDFYIPEPVSSPFGEPLDAELTHEFSIVNSEVLSRQVSRFDHTPEFSNITATGFVSGEASYFLSVGGSSSEEWGGTPVAENTCNLSFLAEGLQTYTLTGTLSRDEETELCVGTVHLSLTREDGTVVAEFDQAGSFTQSGPLAPGAYTLSAQAFLASADCPQSSPGHASCFSSPFAGFDFRLLLSSAGCLDLGTGPDCDANGLLDSCDVAREGSAVDCDANNLMDACEIAGGDCNGNGVPDRCDVPGDFDGDGFIMPSDTDALLACLTAPCSTPPCPTTLYTDPCCGSADADRDGDVDLRDFALWQAHFMACTSDSDCDDGLFCTGLEVCDAGTCLAGIQPCTDPALPFCDEGVDACIACLDADDCEDGQFCTGAEICNAGTCVSDGDPCTDPSLPYCDEGQDTCLACLDSADCDDGLFCNGLEICSNGTCVAGEDPCTDPATAQCDEDADLCVACLPATSVPLTWWSSQTSSSNVYEAGTEGLRLNNATTGFVEGSIGLPFDALWSFNLRINPDGDAGVDRNDYVDFFIDGVLIDRYFNAPAGVPYTVPLSFNGDTLNYRFEFTSSIDSSTKHLIVSSGNATDSRSCSDGVFCNGLEMCMNGVCMAGDNPCTDPATPICDEGTQTCVACLIDAECDDGLFCNGVEACDAGSCLAGTQPCTDPDFPVCDEGADTCSPPIMLSEDFEAYLCDDEPFDWFDTDADNSLLEYDDLFSVLCPGSESAVGTTSTLTNIHSHYVGTGSDTWTDYSFTGRVMLTDATGGIGVTFLSDFPNSVEYYRLRHHQWTNALYISPAGPNTLTGDADSGVNPQPNQWYRFHVEVEDTGSATLIRGNVWLDGTTEPAGWQIDCEDTDAARLTQGTVGLWSMGAGAKYWDELTVEPLIVP